MTSKPSLADTPRRRVPRRRVFGRQKARALSEHKKKLWRELLPDLRITLSEGLEPKSLFEHEPVSISLEIGFGSGEHLLAAALRQPEGGFMGCEVFRDGVASFLSRFDAQVPKCENIRLYDEDGFLLLRALADNSIDELVLLYPDPWPKRRHCKRRFLNEDSIGEMARVLKPKAPLFIASDIDSNIGWTLAVLDASPDFVWTAGMPHDWQAPPAHWQSTRYEQKAIREGRVPCYLYFERK